MTMHSEKNTSTKVGPTLAVGLLAALAPSTSSSAECLARLALNYEKVSDWSNAISSTVGTDLMIGRHFNDLFFRYSLDGPVSGVVKDISRDEATGLVTINVDNTCKWSDGRAISAADVKLGIEALYHPSASNALPRREITRHSTAVLNGEREWNELGIEITDDQNLQFESDLGLDTLITLFSTGYFVPQPSWIVGDDPDRIFSDELPEVFSGPYVIENYENGIVRLAANPYFCGAEPYFKRGVILPYQSTEQFVELAQQYDMIHLYNPSGVEEIASDLRVISWIGERYVPSPLAPTHVGFARMKSVDGPFSDPEIRRAFSLALDWDGPSGLVKRVVEQSETLVEAPSLVPSNYLPSAPAYHRDMRPRSERLEEAMEILKAAGYSEENPLQITTAFQSAQSRVALLMKEMVEANLPIVWDVNEYESTQDYYRDVWIDWSNPVDLSYAEWGTSQNWPLFFIEFFFNSKGVTEEFNQSGRELLDIIKGSSDLGRVEQAEIEAIQMILDENIYIPLFATGREALQIRDVEMIGAPQYFALFNIKYTDDRVCE